MPELPEVETVMRGIEKSALGRSIKTIKINRYDLRVPIPKDFGQRMTGRTIQEFERRGKYIIIHFDSDFVAVLHLGMSGRVRIYDSANLYEANKHDHIVLTLDDDTIIVYEDPRRFGMFYISEGQWNRERPFNAMGPEPLGQWSGKDLLNAVHNKKTSIKSALLDQGVVAGLGNIYVCEALYRSSIHPARPANTLKPKEADSLVADSRKILKEAIQSGGSTLKDYQHTDGSLGYFQHGFSVYDREGGSCSRKTCRSTIKRIVQAGRSTFFCPSCQAQ